MDANLLRRSIRSIPGCAGYIAALAVLFSTAAPSHATPITLAFDVNITDVFAAEPANLPFSVGPGDTVHSKLIFDPTTIIQTGPNTGRADQPFALDFNFHNIVLKTTQYTITTFDNSFVSDSSIHGVVDEMTLECSSYRSVACQPSLNLSPANGQFQTFMTLELMGDSSAFDGPTLSASPSFWNSFILERSFSLTISNQSGDGGLILGTVGNFTATPEPGTFFSACEAFFAIGVFCRARRPIFSD